MSSSVASDTVLVLPAAGLWPQLVLSCLSHRSRKLCSYCNCRLWHWCCLLPICVGMGGIAPSAEKFWEWLILRVTKGVQLTCQGSW